eukprot:g1043.t1
MCPPHALTVAGIRPHIQTLKPFQNLETLLNVFDRTQSTFVKIDAFRRIAQEAVVDAHEENIKLIELRYAPSFASMNHEHSFEDVLGAIEEGIAEGIAHSGKGGDSPLAVGLICIAVGAMGADAFEKTANFYLKNQDRFVGFDMAGAEQNVLDFKAQFKRVKDAGGRVTCHASEDRADGHPQNALNAIESLGAERIGHGIQIVRSTEVMRAVRDRDALLEVSVTSNFLTNAVDSVVAHPARTLWEYGIPLCINTDDPGIMGISLNDEWDVWRDELGNPMTKLKAVKESLRWSRDDDVFMYAEDVYASLSETVPKESDDFYLYVMGSIDSNPTFARLKEDLDDIDDVFRLDTFPRNASYPSWYRHRNHLCDASAASEISTTTPRTGSLNVQLSGRGVSVRAHYDASHNFLVQIYGHKRVLLAAPGEFPTYPEPHPAARQIQQERALRSASVDVLETVMRPGDVLYIPPYWIHHVDYDRDDMGISVNVWSKAEERYAVEKSWKIVASMLGDGTSVDAVLPLWTLVPFVHCIVNAAGTASVKDDGNDGVAPGCVFASDVEMFASRFFEQRILRDRYEFLGPSILNCTVAERDTPLEMCEALAPSLGHRAHACLSSTSSYSSKRVQATCDETISTAIQETDAAIGWQQRAAEAGRTIGTVTRFSDGYAIRDLLLGTFVERIVRTRLTYEAGRLGLRNKGVLGSLWVCPFFQCVRKGTLG